MDVRERRRKGPPSSSKNTANWRTAAHTADRGFGVSLWRGPPRAKASLLSSGLNCSLQLISHSHVVAISLSLSPRSQAPRSLLFTVWHRSWHTVRVNRTRGTRSLRTMWGCSHPNPDELYPGMSEEFSAVISEQLFIYTWRLQRRG